MIHFSVSGWPHVQNEPSWYEVRRKQGIQEKGLCYRSKTLLFGIILHHTSQPTLNLLLYDMYLQLVWFRLLFTTTVPSSIGRRVSYLVVYSVRFSCYKSQRTARQANSQTREHCKGNYRPTVLIWTSSVPSPSICQISLPKPGQEQKR